jgi:hypothetical protein
VLPGGYPTPHTPARLQIEPTPASHGVTGPQRPGAHTAAAMGGCADPGNLGDGAAERVILHSYELVMRKK